MRGRAAGLPGDGSRARARQLRPRARPARRQRRARPAALPNEITSHSNLTLRLQAPESAEFNLQLRNVNGNVIECQCGDSGSQTLAHQLRPGATTPSSRARRRLGQLHADARVAHDHHDAASRFSAKAAAGQAGRHRVKVSPAESGPVAVDIERFDPVFGWQFYRRRQASSPAGSRAALHAAGRRRWRGNASYGGSRTASPSAVGFSLSARSPESRGAPL